MSKTKFLELNPIIDEQMVEKYKESFDFVFDNDQIRNIAVSGIYGSGKTTVLKSYLDSIVNKSKIKNYSINSSPGNSSPGNNSSNIENGNTGNDAAPERNKNNNKIKKDKIVFVSLGQYSSNKNNNHLDNPKQEVTNPNESDNKLTNKQTNEENRIEKQIINQILFQVRKSKIPLTHYEIKESSK